MSRLAVILGLTSVVMFVLAAIGALIYGGWTPDKTYVIPLIATASAVAAVAFLAASVVVGVVSYFTAR
jgi:hypothetical protein